MEKARHNSKRNHKSQDVEMKKIYNNITLALSIHIEWRATNFLYESRDAQKYLKNSEINQFASHFSEACLVKQLET